MTRVKRVGRGLAVIGAELGSGSGFGTLVRLSIYGRGCSAHLRCSSALQAWLSKCSNLDNLNTVIYLGCAVRLGWHIGILKDDEPRHYPDACRFGLGMVDCPRILENPTPSMGARKNRCFTTGLVTKGPPMYRGSAIASPTQTCLGFRCTCTRRSRSSPQRPQSGPSRHQGPGNSRRLQSVDLESHLSQGSLLKRHRDLYRKSHGQVWWNLNVFRTWSAGVARTVSLKVPLRSASRKSASQMLARSPYDIWSILSYGTAGSPLTPNLLDRNPFISIQRKQGRHLTLSPAPTILFLFLLLQGRKEGSSLQSAEMRILKRRTPQMQTL